jgi:hypothetical protein
MIHKYNNKNLIKVMNKYKKIFNVRNKIKKIKMIY